MARLGPSPVIDLTICDSLPDGILDCAPRDLHRLLPGPALIELPGQREAPLFVSVLLHGNEDSGLLAMQQLLRACSGKALPRALMLMIGNVSAAREGLRRLNSQPDYNRVWPGRLDHVGTAEASIMARVHDRVLERQAFAAIDLHNNTGLNPHYGVICSLDLHTLQLASLFSNVAVCFRGIPGTQTASLAGKMPAIAAECGQPGVPANAESAARFVDAALRLSEFSDKLETCWDLNLFHTMAVVKVRTEISFGFGEADAQLCFDRNLDHLNFRELREGARLGQTTHPMPLVVMDESGRDVARDFFDTDGGILRLRRAAMPAMLTCEEQIIRQDCLCYLMERLSADNAQAGRD